MMMADVRWMVQDVEELCDEYARDVLTQCELENGLDDVFGVNGGIGHARRCMIDLPSGMCTCGGVADVPDVIHTLVRITLRDLRRRLRRYITTKGRG